MNTVNSFVRSGLITSVALSLLACGGSSGDGSESYPDAYLQFYNASADSARTQLQVESDVVSSSTFGDVTSVYAYSEGNYEIELNWEDGDGSTSQLYSADIPLQHGYKTLLLMSGDFSEPDVEHYTFWRSELEDEFYLHGMSAISSEGRYDLYVAEAGAPFSEAHLVNTLEYMEPGQINHWDNPEDEKAWPIDSYVLFLTLPGSDEVAFESQSVNFIYASDYFLSVRNSSGANRDNLVVDIILNSGTTTTLNDTRASAQYRVYSALPETQELSVTAVDDEQSSTLAIAGGQLSDFNAVDFGDYRISASSEDQSLQFDNRLMTLNQGESKTLVLFEDPDQGLTSLTMEDSTLPQSFQHHVSVANLIPDYDNIDVYLVLSDETIETADNKILSLDYAESNKITVNNDYYSVVAVYEDSLGIETLLTRSELISFHEDAVYIITLEKDVTTGGYKARVSW